MWILMPRVAMNTLQVAEVNLASLSEIMSWGSPWSLQISRANTLARSAAILEPTRSGTKSAILENLLTMAHSSSHPQEIGRPVIKFMDMDYQGE